MLTMVTVVDDKNDDDDFTTGMGETNVEPDNGVKTDSKTAGADPAPLIFYHGTTELTPRMIVGHKLVGMAVTDAERSAKSLMAQWLPSVWTFKWNRRTNALGLTNFTDHTIELSKPLTEVNDQAQMDDTIKHEIAHALAGNQAGHGPLWKAQCRIVGANPNRVADDTAVNVAPKVLATCPACGNVQGQQRMPRDPDRWACGKSDCKKTTPLWEDRKLQWSRSNGQPVVVKPHSIFGSADKCCQYNDDEDHYCPEHEQELEPKEAALSLEAVISVAEQAMERSGHAGATIHVPEGHVDDPAHQANLAPVVARVREMARRAGLTWADSLRFYASPYQLGRNQAMTDGMNSIVVQPVTNEMVVLHEIAHCLESTHEGSEGHTSAFARKLHDLYGRFISPAAADVFWGIVGTRIDKTSSWKDIQQKAKRIRGDGGVRIISVTGPYVTAHVQGDEGVYETTLQRGVTHSINMWTCSCEWFAYSFGRSGRWKKYEGRMCSHALALQWEAQSKGMFGKDIQEQTETPEWDQGDVRYYTAPAPKEWRASKTAGRWLTVPMNGLQVHALAADVKEAVGLWSQIKINNKDARPDPLHDGFRYGFHHVMGDLWGYKVNPSDPEFVRGEHLATTFLKAFMAQQSPSNHRLFRAIGLKEADYWVILKSAESGDLDLPPASWSADKKLTEQFGLTYAQDTKTYDKRIIFQTVPGAASWALGRTSKTGYEREHIVGGRFHVRDIRFPSIGGDTTTIITLEEIQGWPEDFAIAGDLIDHIAFNSEVVSPQDQTGTKTVARTMRSLVAGADHGGTMIAVRPPEDVCKALMLDTDGAEDFDQLHITLAYIPSELAPDLDLLRQVVESEALLSTPIEACFTGYGLFEGDGTEKPVVALVDSEELSEARRLLCEALDRAGIGISHTHGFLPHMTITYKDVDFESLPSLDKTPFHFDAFIISPPSNEWEFYPLGPDLAIDNHGDHGSGNAETGSQFSLENASRSVEATNLCDLFEGEFVSLAEQDASADSRRVVPSLNHVSHVVGVGTGVEMGYEVDADGSIACVADFKFAGVSDEVGVRPTMGSLESGAIPEAPIAFTTNGGSRPVPAFIIPSPVDFAPEALFNTDIRREGQFTWSQQLSAESAHLTPERVYELAGRDGVRPWQLPNGFWGDLSPNGFWGDLSPNGFWGDLSPEYLRRTATDTEDPTGSPADEDEEGSALPGAQAELNDEPEGALPSTDGAEESLESEPNAAKDGKPGHPVPASLAWLDPRNSSKGMKGDDDMDIAAAARNYLRTSESVKSFTYAEQQEIINEGEGVTASNLDRLQLAGTHYEQLEAQLARAEALDEQVIFW
jgi:2'-5' RNA ligase/predicted SprT family Zn-dependent metalloprotease